MSPISFKINRVLFLFLIVMVYTNTFAQSPSKNYVQTKTFLDDAGTTFLRHIDYYDELGVVAETVDVGVNTSQTPVVTRTEYTTQLKPFYQWAPLPATGLDYIDHVSDKARNTYDTSMAYTENDYDDFQELSSSWKPGDAWEEHPTTVTRHVVPSGEVRKYSVDASGNLCDDGTYPYGILMSTTTTDEDGRSITVYADMHGNTVLERRDGDNDTYYVYDRYGRLAYVLPPMCQHCSTSELPRYWYKYTYDDRGRCTEKQLPGCEPVKYWYDEANRIQSEQDGHLRSQSQYRNYRYDGIGRLVLQAISTTREEATPNNCVEMEVRNHYDNYSFRSEFAQLFAIWSDSIYAMPFSATVAKGKLTATLQSTSDDNRYFEMYGYDELGHMTDKLSAYGDKWLKTVHTEYNFVGDVVSVHENVYTIGNYGSRIVLAKRVTLNNYHPSTRLLATTTVTHTGKNGNSSTQTVSNPSYDVFGNVTANDRPGTAADMAYDYDKLHGWLKGVSSPCGFSEQLQRETAVNAQFSGNIGSMQWRNTSNGELHHYDYTYDALGRLTDALYSSSANNTTGRYDEQVTYNANGSITSLLRNGMKNDGTFGTIDDLTITYNGNRLLKVTDDAEAVNYNGSLDFHDGADAGTEYVYDHNGALTKDSNRGIKDITYDYGHHPYYIDMNQGIGKSRNITYDYTPDGVKLSSRHVMSIQNEYGNTRKTTTDLYIDGLILRDGKPLMWLFDGGYVDLDDNGSPTGWNYYVTDHLGSTRMVVDSNNNIRETINYYPFGSEMRMEDPALMTGDFQHPYRFTGKELDRLNGLNMYDFGARWYDVAGVPMWTSVDPLAEKYYHVSPYAYCNNNPAMFIDPNGEDWTDCDGNKLDNTDNTKVFIFYSADFADQAKVQYDEAINKYGEGTVAMSLTSTTEEFANDWENMSGKYIANVMIMTHGKNQSIALDGGKNQLTSTGDGLTNLKGNKAMNVQDLPTPKGNISNAVLNMYSCHSADTEKKAHGEGHHAQGALKGTKDPIAYAFARNFNFKGVKGTAESVNYHSFLTDRTPQWSNNYLKPYPANGGRWTYIHR